MTLIEKYYSSYSHRILRFLLLVFSFLFVLAPIYKYYELEGLPSINISALRFIIFILSYFIFLLNIKKIIEPNFITYVIGFLFFHLLISVIFLVNYHYVTDYAANANIYFLERIDAVVVNYFMFFLLGTFYVIQRQINNSALRRIVYIYWFLFVVFTIFNLKNLSSAYGANLLDSSGISYIFFADRIAILSILLFHIESKNKRKILIFFVSVILLFLYPSRTSFYIFIFSIVLPFIILPNSRKIAFIILGVILIFILTNYFQDSFEFRNSRIFSISLENNTSLEAREIIFNNNKNIILENLVIGDFMSDVRIARGGGYQIHNFLSLLQDFGLIIFIPFLFYLFKSIYASYKIINQKNLESQDLAMVSLLIFSLIISILSRSHLYPYIFVVFMALPQIKFLYNKHYYRR